MTAASGTLEDLVDLIRGKAPGFLDLLTAKTEDDFDSALEPMIAGAVMHLEKNSKNFSTLGEVELTAVFTASMTIPGLVVTQEAHSNGHVDITVEAVYSNPPKIRLGEAKLYSGYSYHVKGVGQLVGRYSTGREGRGLILAYHRSPNIAGAIKTLREEMDKNLPHAQKGKTADSVVKWSFMSKHAHSSGEHIDVAHYGCNLYDPVAKGSTAGGADKKGKGASG